MTSRVLLLFLLFPLFSFCQECIDSTSINPDFYCTSIYEPVCGCDGQLYSNACEASHYYGVTSYVLVNDNGEPIDCSSIFSSNSICDSISVDVESFDFLFDEGEFVLTINVSTFFTSDEFFEYAGFVLLNSDGEIVAEEGIDAGNMIGFGADYSDTRTLYFDEFFSLPFEGTISLYEGYFFENEELICTLPLSFSLGETSVSLEGQYYFEDEYEYIQFDEDSLFIYDFEDDIECYDFISFQYIANDSIIVLSNSELEEQMQLNYELNGDNLNLSNFNDTVFLMMTSFDSSIWEECENDSSACMIFNVFAEFGECDSLGMLMVDVEFDVVNEQSMGFNITGNGVNYGSFEYGQTYYTLGPILADGETIYEFVISDNDDSSCNEFITLGPIDCGGTTSVEFINNNSKELLFIKNLLGKTVDKINNNSPHIYFFNDGSFEKRVIFDN